MPASEPAIVVHNVVGTIIGWDEQAERLFGYRAEEIVGKPLAWLLSDDPMPLEPVAARVCRTKDGRSLRVVCRRSPINDGADRLLAISEVISASEEVAVERARAESARPIETDYRRLMEALPQLVWISEADGKYRSVSRRCQLFIGAFSAPGAEQPWLGLVHPDDRSRAERSFRASVEDGGELSAELRLCRHDGVYCWFDVRAVRFCAADGAPDSWLVTASDIHEARKLAEQAHADRDRLAGIIATVPGVVASYRMRPDGSTQLLFMSKGAQALYGFSAAELHADASLLVSRLHPEDIERNQGAIAEALRSGEAWHGEYRYQHPETGKKWLGTHFLSRPAADGAPVWNGLVLDITEQKQSEEQLSLIKAQLESALDAVQMGAWVWDPEQNLLWGNETQRRLWGVPDDAPPWYEAEFGREQVHPDDLKHVDAEMARAMVTGERLEMEFRIRRDDQVRWIAMRSCSENAKAGGPRRVVGINLDVTQQKLATETRLRSQKLEALGTLAGGIAHDFNNVLFAISGNAALALRALPEASPLRSFLTEIASASRRATQLVQQILAFSRPEEQRLEVLPLSEPVQEALNLARATIPALVSIEAELDPDTPVVQADASRIVQVVINLCTNAAHAIGRGRAGRILIRLEPLLIDAESRPSTLGSTRMPQGRYAVLSVSDDGCGMDEQTQRRIFDPFFTTKPQGEGTGLGLSVVHGIVKALGGFVSVSSEPHKGSTFRLYLRAAEKPAERTLAQSLAPHPGHGQKILFVDDELMLVQLGKSLLEALGYQAEAYQDAHVALEAFRSKPDTFSAVVTDVSMPTLSGFDLARALLAIRRDVPILVMSGYIGAEERATAQEIGVRELVLKPVTMKQLSELLASLC